ncbi:SpaA isopeptide-forming pilin-related protein [Corynebacterium cystitidis]|uniref:SpaA isopeptide-forming pilin-related protein n=1 Tax=Corynebacterium cystitidis TaxID=35757 RepID=UPI00211EC8AB|nr:SpaA isopeptide-forming pilin-related protein [Corynebacterium cystitidis]
MTRSADMGRLSPLVNKLKKGGVFLASIALVLSFMLPQAVVAEAQGLNTGEYHNGQYWRTMHKEANPELPQMCGLEIAVVLDLSTSVGDDGLAKMKTSLHNWIDEIKGQPLSVKFYTFGTYSPANNRVPHSAIFALNAATGISGARAYVTNLVLARDIARGRTDGTRGGTDWEGPLKDINDSGRTYDVVYFVTDGEPTTNNDRTPFGDRSEPDYGFTVHNQDISRAITQANALKGKGTRIEAIHIGNVPDMPVLHDNVGRTKDRRAYRNGDRYIQLGNRDPDYGTFGRNRQMSYRESILSGTRTYFYKRDEASAQFNGGEPQFIGLEEMIKAISSPDGYQKGDDYSVLGSALSNVSDSFCKTLIEVKKNVVDAEGNIDATQDVSGWEFTLAVPNRSPLLFVNERGQRTNTITSATDSAGSLTAKLKSDHPDQSTTVQLRENPRDGYRLQNLVCTNRSDGTPVEARKQNDSDEFSFTVPTYADIVCEAKNAPSENFTVSKTAIKDQMPEVDGDQPNALVDQDGNATVYYDIAITNEMDVPVDLRGNVVDEVTPPDNFRVVQLRFLLNGEELRHNDGTIPGTALGRFEAKETKTIRAEVDLESIDPTLVQGLPTEPEECLPQSSVRNVVTVQGAESEDCVNLVPSTLLFEKKAIDTNQDGVISADDVKYSDDGLARVVSYQLSVTNPADSGPRSYSLIDHLQFARGVKVRDVTLVDNQNGHSVTDTTGSRELDVTGLLFGGTVKPTIEPGSTHTYDVVVSFDPLTAEEHAAIADECVVAGGGLRNKAVLTSGAIELDDEDCVPIPAPGFYDLVIQKKDIDNPDSLLKNAEFSVIDADGQVISVFEETAPGIYRTQLEVGRQYTIVETRAPEGFQLGASVIELRTVPTRGGLSTEILNQDDVIGVAARNDAGDYSTVTLEVENVSVGDLPLSGGWGILPYLLSGAVIAGFGLLRARS